MPVGKSTSPIKLDWAEIQKMCECQCTQEEIAATVGCSVDTLERHCKKDNGCGLAGFYAEKRKIGFQSLRSMQYLMAKGGDRTMLVWLGKQWLNQRDERHVSADINAGKTISEMTTAELTARIAELEEDDDGPDTDSK
jgi:hypothetical protein